MWWGKVTKYSPRLDVNPVRCGSHVHTSTLRDPSQECRLPPEKPHTHHANVLHKYGARRTPASRMVNCQLLRALSITQHIGTFAKLPFQEISTRSCLANSPAVDAWRSPGASVGNEGPGALSGPVRTILPAGTLTPPQSTHLQSRPARIPDQVSTTMHSRIRKRVSRGPIGPPPCFAWAKCDYEDGRHGMEQGRDRDDKRPE